MSPYPTLFLTERGLYHQQRALAAAPPELEVTVLRRPAAEQLLPHLARAVFLISERAGVIDADLLDAAPNLRLVVRLGSLAHDIDLAAARRRGVAVTIWPVLGAVMVAEHACMLMLALAKRLREVNAVAMQAADWRTPRRTDEDTFAFNWSGRQDIGGLWGRAVGLLGFGEIGAELARRLYGWGCTVLYHRRRRLPEAAEIELGIHYVTWDEILARSDFLVNLLPYAQETDGALGAAQFAQMKPGACLVSCGSGSVIDEAALAAALRSGHLAGAALDTFEWEPLTAENLLRQLALSDPAANVLLTPHTAGAGSTPTRAADYTPILDYLAGRPLPHRLA